MSISRERLLEQKVYKRRRSQKSHKSTVYTKVQLSNYRNEVKIFLRTIDYIISVLQNMGITKLDYFDSDITIGDNFSLDNDYKKTYSTIISFVGAVVHNIGKTIEVDFTKCKKIDTAPIFVMQVVRFEIDGIVKAQLKGLQLIDINTEFKIIPSKNKNVNRLLLLCGLITRMQYEACLKNSDQDNSDIFEPLYRTGYYKGTESQKHYLENKKSIYTTAIVAYLNTCLDKHGTSLNKLGQNSLEGIISEVLNNAEDHGALNSWYATANFSQEFDKSRTDEDLIGQLNLSILNFGQSIYDGLYANRELNAEMFAELLQTKDTLTKMHPQHGFSEDNLFTMYALNDGVSRLKYTDESRGTGTIKFINSFLKLGDYEDKKRSYIPQLSIFSGNTMLICDNDYKPFENNGVYSLTLNSEKSQVYPPAASHLKELPGKFPGTLLNVNLYLSKSHLEKKVINKSDAIRT